MADGRRSLKDKEERQNDDLPVLESEAGPGSDSKEDSFIMPTDGKPAGSTLEAKQYKACTSGESCRVKDE